MGISFSLNITTIPHGNAADGEAADAGETAASIQIAVGGDRQGIDFRLTESMHLIQFEFTLQI